MNTTPTRGGNQSSQERASLMAFVKTPEEETMMNEVVNRLLLPFATVKRGGIEQAIKTVSEMRSPKTLIVDISDSDLPISDIEKLAEVCEPDVNLLVLGSRNDVSLFRDLVAIGVSDYLIKPLSPDLLHRAVSALIDQTQVGHRQRRGRVISFIGTRGGIGTSSLATNVAWYLGHERKRRTIIVDLDLYLGSVGLFLDLDIKHNLREAIESPERVDNIFVEQAVEEISNKFYVLNAEENLEERFKINDDALEVLINKLQENFQYVVLDLRRTPGPLTQRALRLSTVVSLVTERTLMGMRDTVRMTNWIADLQKKENIVIVNNHVNAGTEGLFSRAEFEKNVGRKIDHELPYSAEMARTSAHGKIDRVFKSPVATELISFAQNVAGWGKSGVVPQKSFFERLLGGR